MILDAGDEDLFDIRENGGKAHEILRSEGVVPVQYEIIGVDHYGIYFDGFDAGSNATERPK